MRSGIVPVTPNATFRRVQSNLPAMILVATSIVSAVAAAANLKIWVAVAASAQGNVMITSCVVS